MRHGRFEKSLWLYYYNELDRKNQEEFELHLSSCSRCQADLEEWKKISSALEQYESVRSEEVLLGEARQQFARASKFQLKRWSFANWLATVVYDAIIPKYKIVLGGALLLAGGIFIGYFTFGTSNIPVSDRSAKESEQVRFIEPLSDNPRISNIRFINADKKAGEIDFTFDAVMPVHMKGRLDNPDIQKVLVNALLSDQNPGVRLTSVSALASDAGKQQLDDEVVEALISAIRFDKNPGVRMEALQALENQISNHKVKQAYLDVLMHDDNSGLRITAINLLTRSTGKNLQEDTALLDVLRNKVKFDNNNYIRLRSQAVLKEIRK